MWGMYCCEKDEEGDGMIGEEGCNGGELRNSSICCKNDKQIMCTKNGGCEDKKRNKKNF